MDVFDLEAAQRNPLIGELNLSYIKRNVKKKMARLCFWSVGDGEHAYILQSLVHSFHAAGMQEDFHAFSDRPIEGAFTHPIRSFEKHAYLFKFAFLHSFVQKLEGYTHFAFLDADNYFVRKPKKNFNEFVKVSPLIAFLESDCTSPNVKRHTWRDCPLPDYIRFMREMGVKSKKIYNVNAGFFIVEKAMVETVCRLALEFWEHAYQHGVFFTEEAPLAYAAHMLTHDLEQILLHHHFDLWASDWTGHFINRLPNGEEWIFDDYMTGKPYFVNPAIVHALRSKQALIAQSKGAPPP